MNNSSLNNFYNVSFPSINSVFKKINYFFLFLLFSNPGVAQVIESFDSPLNNDWVVVDAERAKKGPSSWSVSEGQLIQNSNIYSSKRRGTHLYYNPGFELTDVSIQWDQTSHDNDGIGLLFRYEDENNYYRFSSNLERSYRRLEKNINGVFTVLAEDTVPYIKDVAQTARIEINGDRIQVFVDGNPVFDVTDASHTQGTFAFHSYGNIGIRFDNLIVEEALVEAVTEGQISEKFSASLSSDWVVSDATNAKQGPSSWFVSEGKLNQSSNIYSSNKTGTHLYYNPGFELSNVSIQWDQTSNDNDGIGLLFRYEDENNYYRFSSSLERSYRRLEKNVNGVFTVLAEDTVPYVKDVAQTARIEINGDRIQVFVDGNPVFDVTDASHTQGTFAFYSYGNIGIRFDNLIVNDIASSQMPPVATDETLLSHWKLDESNGSEASDSAGNNPGILVNSPILQPTQGQIGGALEFDGADDRVDLGALDVSGTEMSIAFWFKADDFDVSDARFISKASSTSSSGHYWMVSALNGSKLRFRLKTNGETTTLISSADTISSGQWHHVVASYDGNEMRIYRDGELVASTAKTGELDTNSSVPVALGNQPANAGLRAFDGLLDDVRVYTVALSDSQIQSFIGDTLAQTGNQPPVSNAGNDQTVTTDNRGDSVLITLDGSGSYDTDGSISSMEWRNQDNVMLGNSAVITASLPLGVHLINLTVMDNEGSADTDTVTVEIQSGTINDVPPSVSITSPANGATISGTLNLSATATDDNAIAGVQFQVDGINFGSEDTIAPYSISFDSTTVSDGSYSITAIATDSADQIVSTSIDVTVSNADLPPLACADGLDNDGDGLFDYPEDLGCISLNDNSEIDSSEDGSWTAFSPSADTRIVYVSDSTGNDSSCGSYAASQISDVFHPGSSFIPCKTISTAKSIYNALPNNEPHWILFKSGDSWINQSFGKWERSGRSATEPTLMASYGDSLERPKVLTGESSFAGAVSNGVKYVTVADLFIHAHTYINGSSTSKPRAFRWISNTPAGDWVFEGLHVQGYHTAFLLGSSQDPYYSMISNISFRNNIFNGNQGENAVYMSGIFGLKLFEGNTFYDNAYTDNHTDGAYRGKHIYLDNENGYAPADPTGHSIYRNNFFIDATAYGFSARTGGEIYNNYVESHGFGIQIGNHDGGQLWPIVPVSVHDNVVMHLVDSLNQTLGYGINIENSDANVERNIIAYYGSVKGFGHPFWITGDAGNTAKARMSNNTIYSTVGDIREGGDLAPIVQTDNLINDDMDLLATNSRSSTVNFVDPSLRDLAKYNRDILGGTRDVEDFMSEALKQWRGNFRLEYTVNEVNDYIRRGFEPDGSQPEMCDKGAVPCGFSATN